MWRLAVRDLAWRRRRFLIAVVATALVFAITLLLAGLSASMGNEPGRAVGHVGADSWFVSEGTTGPFTTTQFLSPAAVDKVRAAPGVTEAEPIVIGHATIVVKGEVTDTNIVGHVPGALGTPPLGKGRPISTNGEVVADTALGLSIDDKVKVGTLELTVVGTASRLSFNFGIASLYATVADAQRAAFGGQPLISAVVVKGHPSGAIAGLTQLQPNQVAADMKRPVDKGLQIITLVSAMLWVVAAGIVGSIVYMTALERTRDFAVLKATGTSNRDLFISLGVQALVLSALAAVVAVVVAKLLAPIFPMDIDMEIGAYIGLIVLSVTVALVASVLGLRRAVTVDPALAFGG